LLEDGCRRPASGASPISHAGGFDLLSELWVEREGLRARFWLENAPPPQPWFQVLVEAVSAGGWSEKVRRVYGGPGNVIQDPELFRLGFDGHNLATSFVGSFANGVALFRTRAGSPTIWGRQKRACQPGDAAADVGSSWHFGGVGP
jgi:hypothetical protein